MNTYMYMVVTTATETIMYDVAYLNIVHMFSMYIIWNIPLMHGYGMYDIH